MKFLFSLIAGLSISICAEEQILSLGEHGSVRYIYENGNLVEIDRLNAESEVMYSHTYQYSEEGRLISEGLIGDLGKVIYDKNRITSPVSTEEWDFDENHNLVRHRIDGALYEYSYDSENKMVIQEGSFFAKRDENGDTICSGDNEYFYDDAHQLIKVVTPNHLVEYAYDGLGNRISRTVDGEIEYFIYFENNEIGILDSKGRLKEFRIPGLTVHQDILRPIAIETKDGIYAPIHDYQGNIIRLVSMSTQEVIQLSIDPFGRGIPEDLPTSWIFCGKHYDQEVGLIYFGERYYSPSLRKWLTPDLLNQSSDPYEFCLGNPLFYIDPDGEWAISLISIAWGAGATITAPVWGPYAAAAALGTAAGYLGYKAYEHWQENKEQPPYTWDDLGDDPYKCPDEGFVWKGTGDPGSGRGNWVKGKKKNKEELHPDLRHPDPIGPHWDYNGPKFPEGVRIKPDGTWAPK